MEIQCLSMESKNNYHLLFKNTLKTLGKLPKPTLLLHVCCGPCFTYPFELLKGYFDITIMYNNSNIYPKEEYYRRLNELKDYVKRLNAHINIIEEAYDNITYTNDLEPYKDLKEGGERCKICFTKRLSYGFAYADAHGFDYYGTVMTISRFKNSQIINQIGEQLQKMTKHTKWLYSDFKKEDGYQKSLEIVRKENMYFQHYCGCKYSYEFFHNKKCQKL